MEAIGYILVAGLRNGFLPWREKVDEPLHVIFQEKENMINDLVRYKWQPYIGLSNSCCVQGEFSFSFFFLLFSLFFSFFLLFWKEMFIFYFFIFLFFGLLVTRVGDRDEATRQLSLQLLYRN